MWKIGDFGLTTDGTSKKKWTTRYVRGTNCYRAPELIREEKYTNKVDIFAFGCVLYEATFSKKAFSDDFLVVQYAITGSGVVYPTPPQSARDEKSIEEATTIIRKALEVDPKRRPRAQELHQTLLDLHKVHRQDEITDRKILCRETVNIDTCTEIHVDELLSSGRSAVLEQSDIATNRPIVGQETAAIRSSSVTIPGVESFAEIFVRHMEAVNQGSRQNSTEKISVEHAERNNIISAPYYVSSNIFNSRIAIFSATIEGSYKVQLWDAKTLTTVWERPFVREELTWVEQYPSFSLDGRYVGFYIAGYIQVLDTVTGREFQNVSIWNPGTVAFAVGPNGRVAAASTYNYKREPDRIRKGPAFDNVVLTPREQAPRIFYTRDGKQIFVIYMDGSTNTGVGVMTLRVEILTIESGKRKSLFKVDKASSYEAGGTIILDDKDCIVLDIKFPDPERSEYGDRWERRVLAVSTSSKVKDLRVFEKDKGDGVVIHQGGVISVGLHGSVKRYGKSGPTVLVEWNASTEFKRSRVVACDEERLTVLSPIGRLEVFELANLKRSRTRQAGRTLTATEAVLQRMRAAQM